MKILTIIGARPQFIKAAVLSREITESQTNIEEIIVHTGQHFDSNMSDIFFEEMNIPNPKYHLNIQSKFHGEMTGLMMIEIEKIAIIEKPDWILVYGDTNSTLAGALVASKLHIKLAHVEAGLRSFNNNMPEEINRILTDRLSNILFCPTNKAMNNLEEEGYNKLKNKSVINVGDIMYDSAKYYSMIDKDIEINLPENFILSTIHRPVNTDNPENLLEIFDTLNKIGEEFVIFTPIHPRTKDKLELLVPNIKEKYPNIIFSNPVSYFEMINILKKCKFVITDSGGLQKEAYFFKKMCITLRNETEWVELVENNYNFLSEINTNKILELVGVIKNTTKNFTENLYGNGNTGKLILEALKNYK